MDTLDVLAEDTTFTRFLKGTGTVLLDAAKTVPFVKGFIDRENYTRGDFAQDVLESLIIAALIKIESPRLIFDQVLLGVALTSRFYKEVTHDFKEGFQKTGEYLDSKFENSRLYQVMRSYFMAADTIVRDGYSLSCLLSGWCVADIGIIGGFGQEDPATMFNYSSIQHFLALFGGGNMLMRIHEEHHFQKTGIRMHRSGIRPWLYLGIMVAALFRWEKYEIDKLGYQISPDYYGDIGVGAAGFMASMEKSPEDLLYMGKFYARWIGSSMKASF
ncbi:MAG: hypothetical protein ABIJ34_02445 [archaeon]